MRRLEGFQRGINLGGWLSQGPLDKHHLDTFIVEDDIKKIAGWGADHVRLPLDYENVETEEGGDIEEGYRHIEDCISWCRKYNLNMCLTCTKHPDIFLTTRTIQRISSTTKNCRNAFLIFGKKS